MTFNKENKIVIKKVHNALKLIGIMTFKRFEQKKSILRLIDCYER